MDAQVEDSITTKPAGRIRSIVQGLVSKYGYWTKRLSGAMLDQAVFSGGNFLVSILLGRWLSPDDYGAFVVAYSWLMLCLTAYDGILSEPSAIYGAGKYADQYKRYLAYLTYGHIGVTLFITLLVGIGTVLSSIFDKGVVASAMAGLTVMIPLLLSRWLTRQPFYVLSCPHLAAVGGIVYLLVAVGALFACQVTGILTPVTALIVLGIASLIASLFLLQVYLKPQWKAPPDSTLNARMIVRDHWDYGRWSIPSRMLGWIPANIYAIALPLTAGGLAASATLRAIGNLFMPMTLTLSALNGVLLPSFVRIYTLQGKQALNGRIKGMLIFAVAIATLYCLTTVIFGKWIISMVYHGQYDSYVTLPLLISFAVFPITQSVEQILSMALRAVGLVKLTLVSQAIWGVTSVTWGIALMVSFGLLGVNIGQFFVALAVIAVLVRFYRRQFLNAPAPAESLHEKPGEVK